MGKKFIVKVRGEAYEVEVEEVMEGPGAMATAAASTAVTAQAPAVAKPAPAAPVSAPAPKVEQQVVSEGEQVTAPIPGTILRVNVKVGDKVKPGDVVVVLEAMKLENEISAFTSGEVKQVLVSAGSAVNEGNVLVVIG